MAKQDYYEVLGVGRNDSGEDIRKAFRKKAMEFHPDRNKNAGAEEKFKEVNEAYQVLSDTNKRAHYDRYGQAGVDANGGFDRPFEGYDVFGGFGDIFDSFFGDVSGRRATQAQRGADLQEKVRLSFEEAVFGAEREVEITRSERCHRCSGEGSEPGTQVTNCTTCRGTGQARRSQRSIFGQLSQLPPCSLVRGSRQLDTIGGIAEGEGADELHRTNRDLACHGGGVDEHRFAAHVCGTLGAQPDGSLGPGVRRAAPAPRTGPPHHTCHDGGC